MAWLPSSSREVLVLVAAGLELEAALYVNHHLPVVQDRDNGDDYEEASWSGYSRKDLVPAGGAVERDTDAYQDFEPVFWTVPAGATGVVYGVCVWNKVTGTLVDALLYPLPFPLEAGREIPARLRLVCKELKVESSGG